MYWNYNKTLNGLFSMLILTFLFFVTLYNLYFINSINRYLPIGYLLLVVFGTLIFRHIYSVLKWYSIWLEYKRDIDKIIVHACLYLIVISIAFTLSSYSPEESLIKRSPFVFEIEPHNPLSIIEKIHQDVTKPWYPEIKGATPEEYQYVINILNNSHQEVRDKIKTIFIASESEISNLCGDDAAGCAISDGKIYVMHLWYWKNGDLCSSFSGTLNHEIGHIYGFSIGDYSEQIAENYAFDHTTVLILYEPNPKC